MGDFFYFFQAFYLIITQESVQDRLPSQDSTSTCPSIIKSQDDDFWGLLHQRNALGIFRFHGCNHSPFRFGGSPSDPRSGISVELTVHPDGPSMRSPSDSPRKGKGRGGQAGGAFGGEKGGKGGWLYFVFFCLFVDVRGCLQPKLCDLWFVFFLCFFRCVSPFCEVEQQLPLKNSIDILKEKKTNYPRQHDFFSWREYIIDCWTREKENRVGVDADRGPWGINSCNPSHENLVPFCRDKIEVYFLMLSHGEKRT